MELKIDTLSHSTILAMTLRQKSQQGEQNTCRYVSEICAEGIFVNFPGD